MATRALRSAYDRGTVGGGLVDQNGVLGHQIRQRGADRSRRQRPARDARRGALGARDADALGVERARQHGERAREILLGGRHLVEFAAGRALEGRFVAIGEGRDRKERADEHQLLEILQEVHSHLVLVGDRLEERATLAAGEIARSEGLAEERRAGFRGDSGRCLQGLAMKREIAEDEPGFLAVGQEPAGMFDRFRRGLCARPCLGRRGRIGFVPMPVGPGDDRCDFAGLGERGGLHSERAEVGGAAGFFGPVRDDAGDIGDPPVDEFVFGIVRLMVGGVGADDVDDRRVGAAGVVQHRDAIGEAAADVQESEGRGALHAPVAVRRARHDVFLKAEDRPHALRQADLVDELHFRRSGIGETGRDACIHQGFEERLGAVHRAAPVCLERAAKKWMSVFREKRAEIKEARALAIQLDRRTR